MLRHTPAPICSVSIFPRGTTNGSCKGNIEPSDPTFYRTTRQILLKWNILTICSKNDALHQYNS